MYNVGDIFRLNPNISPDKFKSAGSRDLIKNGVDDIYKYSMQVSKITRYSKGKEDKDKYVLFPNAGFITSNGFFDWETIKVVDLSY